MVGHKPCYSTGSCQFQPNLDIITYSYSPILTHRRIEKFANLKYVYFIEEVGLLIDQDDERWPAKDRYEHRRPQLIESIWWDDSKMSQL